VDSDLPTYSSRRRAGTKALSKSPSGAPHKSADAGHANSSSPSYDAGSPLHFYGLAATQTQTQVVSGAEASGEPEGSDSRVCVHVFSTSLGCFTSLVFADALLPVQVAKRRKLSHDRKVHSSPKAQLQTSNDMSEAGAASRSASKLKRRRPPSPASTDSFAEAEEWEDPAKIFLASNRQFKVPLSELGRGATQGEFREGCSSMAETPLRDTLREPIQVDRSHISSTEGFPASGSGATDAQHPGGQNEDVPSPMSDVSTDAQEQNRFPIPDIPDDASTPPVMSNPGLIDDLDARAEDYQATQPLGSEDLDIGTTQVSDTNDSFPTQTSPRACNSMVSGSRPSTNTRSNILSMVNPAKTWRLQRGKQLAQAALQTGSDGQTQPSANFSRSSHVPSTGRLLFDQLAAQMRAEQELGRDLGEQSPPYLPPIDEDSRETAIVPDSEPPEPANTASTVARPHSATPPIIPRFGGLVDSSLSCLSPIPSMALEDEDAQHDKEKDGQLDDDEEDVPLLLTVGRPGNYAPPPSAKVRNLPKVLYPSHYRLLALLTTIFQVKDQAISCARTNRACSRN
jgi:hypothetical protein